MHGQGGSLLFEENPATTTDYLYLLDKPFGKVEDGEVYYYATDHLGTVTAITDAAGQAVWKDDATPFGENTGTIGTRQDALRFTGKSYDAETGLWYFNARWYDGTTGRFITEDPAKDGLSWYVYAGNNPLKFIDPSGLAKFFYNEKDEYQTTVEKGDTLSKISEEYYGSAKYTDALAAANDIKNRDKIQTGQNLKMPYISELVGDEEFDTNYSQYMKDETVMLNNMNESFSEYMGVEQSELPVFSQNNKRSANILDVIKLPMIGLDKAANDNPAIRTAIGAAQIASFAEFPSKTTGFLAYDGIVRMASGLSELSVEVTTGKDVPTPSIVNSGSILDLTLNGLVNKYSGKLFEKTVDTYTTIKGFQSGDIYGGAYGTYDLLH